MPNYFNKNDNNTPYFYDNIMKYDIYKNEVLNNDKDDFDQYEDNDRYDDDEYDDDYYDDNRYEDDDDNDDDDSYYDDDRYDDDRYDDNDYDDRYEDDDDNDDDYDDRYEDDSNGYGIRYDGNDKKYRYNDYDNQYSNFYKNDRKNYAKNVQYMQSNSYSITINVNNHRLTLFKNGKVYKTYPVAVGKASTPTPRGTFKIINKAINPGGPFGVRWLGLNIPKGSYGIHGTNNPSSIGKNISNGCIRMYNKDVLELSNIVPVGTTVNIV